MAFEEELPPEPRLMESMRSVGYTLEAALADLIDNSISAGATTVDINFGYHPEDYVAIVDDGSGLSLEAARQAMRLAGMSPSVQRREDDLGRFGLGLKTASLSQCRDLIIISLGPDGLIALEWDLDHLQQTGKWTVLLLNPEESENLPGVAEVTGHGHGTVVLWRRLDVLRAQAGDNAGVDAAMHHARNHLQLVFHRFIAGEHGRKFQIRMNSTVLTGVDPFLRTNKATSAGPEENFVVDGQVVRVQPFTLPHLNRLSRVERERAVVGGDSLRDSQGFYVYRAKRLVIWGTWFRLRQREDMAKLARVRVDIPNTLDHLWALDVKKSAAQPPPEVKQRLKRFGERMVEPSRRAFRFRGRKNRDGVTRIWDLIQSDPEFSYEINRDHPLVSALASQVDLTAQGALEEMLRLIERSFPADDLFSRLAGDAGHLTSSSTRKDDLDAARAIWAWYHAAGGDPSKFVSNMRFVEPFSALPDAEELLTRAMET